MIATFNESNLIIIVAVIAIVCAIALLFASALPGFLIVISGVLLVGVTPGYAWTYAVFPNQKIALSHRLFMSVPLSIVMTAMGAFIMSAFLRLSWTPLSVGIVLLAITLAGSGVALSLRRTTH